MSDGANRKADVVAEDLLSQIVSGELEVGSLLPKEAELSAHYAVNRSVIREAIKLLEVHRLVHPVRRRGTEVLDPIASLSPEVLRAFIAPRGHSVNRTFLKEMLEVRALIDEQMGGLAAERRTDADLAEMDRGVARLRATMSDTNAFQAGVDELSMTMARATHNRVLEMMAHWNRTIVGDLTAVFSTTRPNSPAYVDGLELLVSLIRAQAVEPVQTAIRAYHSWAIPRLLMAAALHSGEELPSDLSLPNGHPFGRSVAQSNGETSPIADAITAIQP